MTKTSHDLAALIVAIVDLAITVLYVVCIGAVVLAVFVGAPIWMAVDGNPWPLVIVGVLALTVAAYLILDWWGHKA